MQNTNPNALTNMSRFIPRPFRLHTTKLQCVIILEVQPIMQHTLFPSSLIKLVYPAPIFQSATILQRPWSDGSKLRSNFLMAFLIGRIYCSKEMEMKICTHSTLHSLKSCNSHYFEGKITSFIHMAPSLFLLQTNQTRRDISLPKSPAIPLPGSSCLIRDSPTKTYNNKTE